MWQKLHTVFPEKVVGTKFTIFQRTLCKFWTIKICVFMVIYYHFTETPQLVPIHISGCHRKARIMNLKGLQNITVIGTCRVWYSKLYSKKCLYLKNHWIKLKLRVSKLDFHMRSLNIFPITWLWADITPGITPVNHTIFLP